MDTTTELITLLFGSAPSDALLANPATEGELNPAMTHGRNWMSESETLIGGNSTHQTGTLLPRIESESAGDAMAEKQHGSQGASVGVAVGDSDGADADDSNTDATDKANAAAQGETTVEQQHGSQGAGVGAAVGDIAGAGDGAGDGARGLTFTEVLEERKRQKTQASASGNRAVARPASTTNTGLEV
ncbi:unnamed protein product [Closterium sp. NIES-54]